MRRYGSPASRSPGDAIAAALTRGNKIARRSDRAAIRNCVRSTGIQCMRGCASLANRRKHFPRESPAVTLATRLPAPRSIVTRRLPNYKATTCAAITAAPVRTITAPPPESSGASDEVLPGATGSVRLALSKASSRVAPLSAMSQETRPGTDEFGPTRFPIDTRCSA